MQPSRLQSKLRCAVPALLASAVALTSGCAMVRQGASAALTPVAGDLAASLQRESDVAIVREGAPAYLLLLGGLADSPTAGPAVLLAAADARAAYAAAFLGEEPARALLMYERARDYGLRVLSRNRRFREALGGSIDEFEAALSGLRRKDVPALYTTANAWAGWILCSGGSMEAMAQFPRALAMMQRVLALDPSWQHGGPDMFFGIYFAVQPLGAGRDLARSKAHFERAFEHAGPDALLPRVTFAEFYARYAFDRELFERTLREALSPRADPPDLSLVNGVTRLRAR